MKKFEKFLKERFGEDEDDDEMDVESQLEETLVDVLLGEPEFKNIRTFEEEGVLSRNKGLVFYFQGQKFQLTIA